jgi:uncharacterized protein YegP (UPF0339 family)
MKIVAYKGRGQHPWRWRLVARNGKIVADSAEGYSTRSNLLRAARRIARLWQTAPHLDVIWR